MKQKKANGIFGELETLATQYYMKNETDKKALLEDCTEVISEIIFYSCANTLYDPDRKKANETASNNGCSKRVETIKREHKQDKRNANILDECMKHEYSYSYNKNGDKVRIIANKDLHEKADELINERLGEFAPDVKQQAYLHVMEELQKAIEIAKENGYKTVSLFRKYEVSEVEEKSKQRKRQAEIVPFVRMFSRTMAYCQSYLRSHSKECTSYEHIKNLQMKRDDGTTEKIILHIPRYTEMETEYHETRRGILLKMLSENAPLSAQESVVLKLRESGASLGEIAEQLGIAKGSAKKIQMRIASKAEKSGLLNECYGAIKAQKERERLIETCKYFGITFTAQELRIIELRQRYPYTDDKSNCNDFVQMYGMISKETRERIEKGIFEKVQSIGVFGKAFNI